MIRGKAGGLEIVFSDRPFADAYDELLARLREGGGFYRGTQATVSFTEAPSSEELERVAVALSEAGISWDGAYALNAENAAGAAGRDALREFHPQIELSDAARSLVADFAGARSDLRARRHRGPLRRPPEPAPVAVKLAAVQQPESGRSEDGRSEQTGSNVLYHRGTLRGGQSLANVGHVVVVGDVNPGAELVAGGDILVFGALRGVAHAGAQGDRSARVYALALEPTQLRIATTIAAGTEQSGSSGPEEAFLDGDRIAIVAAGGTPNLRIPSTAEKA